MTMSLRIPASLLSPAGPKARLSILIFHRVLAQPDPLFPSEVDAALFDRLCSWIKSMFQVLPLDEAVRLLRAGKLPARAACITFDDGYADNRTQALPILQRHGLPAMFYIATGFLDGGRMWNDTVIESLRATKLPSIDFRALGVDGLGTLATTSVPQRRAAIDHILLHIKHLHPDQRLALTHAIASTAQVQLPDDLMMSAGQVREMRAAGMLIGAHTVSHPILASLSDDEAGREIAASRTALEAILGEPIAHFAYPNGKPGKDYNQRNVDIVRELGFESAVCTEWGAARASTDPLQLPRFSPWDATRMRFGLRMLHNLWST